MQAHWSILRQVKEIQYEVWVLSLGAETMKCSSSLL